MLELARVFLKLGAISIGGPAAHIALMHHEFVERRRWLTSQEFLDLVGATNLIPGPNSTELAIHIGHMRAGWPGLLIAGTCFIIPAVAIVGALAALYVRAGSLPATQAMFYGVNPVVTAIVLVALWQLGRTAVRERWHVGLAVAAVVAVATGQHELLVLGLSALVGAAIASRRGAQTLSGMFALNLPTSIAAVGVPAVAAVTFGKLFLVFLKAGGLLFGSGYVLLAFLRADLVDRLGWITEHQLLDAIAIGQITPGPVFATATFIGYLVGGPTGSAIATVGIFLPAFVYVAVSGPLIPRLRRSPLMAGVLDGVNIASLALMSVVLWRLGRTSVFDVTTATIAAVCLAALLSKRVNPMWLVAAGAVVGLVAK